MNTTYKKPSKIRVSRERKVDILDLLETTLSDITNENYTNPKVSVDHPHYENILDLNDLYREIQGADYVIELLKKLKAERAKDADKLLKKVFKK
jgi:hypothetical protein